MVNLRPMVRSPSCIEPLPLTLVHRAISSCLRTFIYSYIVSLAASTILLSATCTRGYAAVDVFPKGDPSMYSYGTNVLVHPSYNETTLEGDLAITYLNIALNLGGGVNAIGLSSVEPNVGESVTVASSGQSECL